MSTSATGKVIDEHGVGLGKLGVTIDNVDRHLDLPLARDVTTDDGSFSLHYVADLPSSDQPGSQARQLRLRIKLGQYILHEIIQTDVSTFDVLAFPAIQLKRGEAESEWATLGTGLPSRMTAGNRLQWLVDDEIAWARVADLITDSETHLIDDPRRGDSASKGPIHDVSVGLRGPIVGHMQELFNAHWNLAESDDQVLRHERRRKACRALIRIDGRRAGLRS